MAKALTDGQRRAYRSWVAMRQRCRQKTTEKAHRYAQRGITIDPRWDTFDTFLADMGERPVGTTLDRRDNAIGYSRDNCRWATPKEQAINRDTSVFYTHAGETRTSSEWSRRIGGGPELVRQRLRKGWTLDAALTTPIDKRKATRKKRNELQETRTD